MANKRYPIEPLGQHNRAAFACGVDALDHYFREQAKQDMKRRIAAVFVLRDTQSQVVVGYYTLSSYRIALTELPHHLAKKLPRYEYLPATLLGRLAVHQQYQGHGFGRILLLDALFRALRLADEVASMAVVVDAKDDAARAFYERYEFARLTENGYKLYIPMETIKTL
ncbi:GNAT family N-acetyltransferase [Nitrolancea hollandica]|uniref:N-acetyltransferase domain-containing protein n=1 Tax=Nitrolancea hollandica Lb TaxID=1129897 RepID=I4EFI5_9BACT|nr:GNAT family N-acetyltransferase [Nitrolancea hollandica]CCF83447.1 conserved hypothetical protein [Nitrolancea hollandica Lb]